MATLVEAVAIPSAPASSTRAREAHSERIPQLDGLRGVAIAMVMRYAPCEARRRRLQQSEPGLAVVLGGSAAELR